MILEELLKNNVSNIVSLYIIDLSSISGNISDIYRFFPGTTELNTPITWQGEVYQPLPLTMDGIEWNGQGTLPTPKIKVSNIGGIITALTQEYSDMIGAKLTRKRTLLIYLDAINFISGNSSADPTAYFPDEIYYVDRKSFESNTYAEFELVSALDISSIKLPRRLVIQNLCSWRYRSAECNYTGSDMYTEMGGSTTDPNLDKCGKKLSDCELRFGTTGTLNYGGFPGAGLYS
jgi:lambda family phage minor tail protein L